jgi:dTDP-4-amino-4,6-dideoxygalactose transaminase
MGNEELQEIQRVIEGGNLFRMSSPLREVARFEEEWAEHLGAKHCVCVSGGTAALICSLAGLGIGPGDEVIVPGYTFMASAVAVLAVGAIPVLADIDESLTIDPASVEERLSPHTRAIMPVHMMGMPADMERITEIAQRYGLKVVEDSCQADGGSFKGRRLGTWGDVGAFSFNFWKILSAGEGGAVVTDDPEVFERALIHHDSGSAFRIYAGDIKSPIWVGQQYRVSEILGAFLRVQLSRLEPILSDLRSRKKLLMSELSKNSDITFAPSNDIEGDCGVTIPIRFEAESDARGFAETENVHGTVPIDTGRHVFTNWAPIIEKRGAHHEALNPFHLKENQDLNASYGPEMCPNVLDILSRTVYVGVDPEWNDEQVVARAKELAAALESSRSAKVG